MNTQTSLIAEQIRLQQWADQIRDCQNRPSDMKVDAWCQEHGITKANYYYRLRRVREACQELCDPSPSFVELTTLPDSMPVKTSQPHSPAAASLHTKKGITIDLYNEASSEFLQKPYRSSRPCLMMLPGSRKYILPPDTRICAGAWKGWQTSYVSVFIWIPMTEIPSFFSVVKEQTVSRDSCGREMDFCYYTNGWITVLSTGREAKRKRCQSLQSSMRCSCRDWRLLPDIP